MYNEKASVKTKQYVDLLDPDAKAVIIATLECAYKIGINAQVSCTYRTFTEQDAIYQQGRTKPGAIVSNAKAGQSIHNYRRAADLFVIIGGKGVWERQYFQKIWNEAVKPENALDKKGLAWGGNWKSFADTPHFEVTFGKSWRDFAKMDNVNTADIDAGNWRKYKNFI